MLADMQLELGHPQTTMTKYEVPLKLSPNRLNGLYNASLAAKATGDKAKANFYYSAPLKSTNNSENSTRSELAHAKSFVSSTQRAAN